MRAHSHPHPLADRRIRISGGTYEGALATVVDWYDRTSGRSWRANGVDPDPAATEFAFRSAYERTPCDDEVVVIRLATGLALLHVEQLGAVQADLTRAPASAALQGAA